PGSLSSFTSWPCPVPIPFLTSGLAEGGPTALFGSPILSRLICGSCASCGATTVGLMINFGSGFLGGSGFGGTNCLSAAFGNFLSEGGVIVFLLLLPSLSDLL